MATNSTTTALIVGAGALTDFIMRGEWTWRSFFISLSGAVVGFFASILLVYFFASGPDVPEMVRLAITFFCGYFSHAGVRRVNKMRVKAALAGIELESNGDDR